MTCTLKVSKIDIPPMLRHVLSPNHTLNRSFLVYSKRLDLFSHLNLDYYSAITDIPFGWLIIHNNIWSRFN